MKVSPRRPARRPARHAACRAAGPNLLHAAASLFLVPIAVPPDLAAV
jgi:hypothetical protein